MGRGIHILTACLLACSHTEITGDSPWSSLPACSGLATADIGMGPEGCTGIPPFVGYESVHGSLISINLRVVP
jgi:hypothetical protein